jgi:hypothetical protein
MLRRTSIIVLTGHLAACSEAAPVLPPRPSPSPGAGLGSCTVLTLDGIVSERAGAEIRPVPGATVELFLADKQPSGAEGARLPESQATTDAGGRYRVCFPLSAVDGSGLTPPGGQAFEVRARKEGFSPASASFKFGYSVWDYGGMSLNLELVRQ